METYTVGQFKARFSEIIEKVKSGKSIGVTYGKKKNLIGVFEPKKEKAQKRKLGILEGKAKVEFKEDFKFKSYEEFLGEE